MSAKTKTALDEAIRAHILDEYDAPRIVTDYAVLCANQGLDADTTGYFYTCSPGMPPHTLTGLVGHFLRRFQHTHTHEGRES